MKRRGRLIPTALAGLALCLIATTAIPILATTSSGGRLPPTQALSGIPPRGLSAYQATEGWCDGLRWQLVAAIGEVETHHGTFNGAVLDPDTGEVTPWIFGPPLDGGLGVQHLAVGKWIGWWGLAGPWHQAVGPMQFLAPTFEQWSVDADGDGIANPHDIDDAAATAANYLCGGRDGAISDERTALLRYNRSVAYAREVIARADSLAPVPFTDGDGDGWLCPVAGPVSFTDTWGAPRPGGRRHQGVDILVPRGTPVIAPVAGTIEHRSNHLGGLSFHLWGDDDTYYYGTHLDAYGPVQGWVTAGTVIGYVGDTGNARGTAPHLHFEIHPQRTLGDSPSPINPTPTVDRACSPYRIRVGITGSD